jgi:aminoglycoside phosphotransferase family enzyme
VVAKYRVWLWRQIQRQGPVYRELLCLAEAARQEDLYLIRWRKQPGRQTDCHGDILKSALAWINETRGEGHWDAKQSVNLDNYSIE